MALSILKLANAQDLPIRWGIKGGMNLSQMNIDDGHGQFTAAGMRAGFHLGSVAEYLFSDALALQPALLFMQNGSGELSNTTLTFNQIQLPVNIKYSFKPAEFKMFVAAGPYVGYLLSATAKQNGVSVDLFNKSINAEPMRRIDYGLNIGTSVELNENIDVGFGYQLGLSNLFPGNSTNRINTITLSASYFFD